MSVTSSVSAAGLTASSVATTAAKNMGKDAFLQLLVTQLRHQDPLSPMQDTDFIAQLAQFSSLEQMTNMSASFANVGKSAGFTQALSLTGKWIDYVGGDGLNATGKVEGVVWNGGTASLVVGDEAVRMDDVTRVYPGVESIGRAKSAAQAVALIGSDIDYLDPLTGSTASGKVTGVSLADGAPKLIVGSALVDLGSVLSAHAGSESDTDLAAFAYGLVGLNVDYKSGDQVATGKVESVSADGGVWKLRIGSGLVALEDVIKAYPVTEE